MMHHIKVATDGNKIFKKSEYIADAKQQKIKNKKQSGQKTQLKDKQRNKNNKVAKNK